MDDFNNIMLSERSWPQKSHIVSCPIYEMSRKDKTIEQKED